MDTSFSELPSDPRLALLAVFVAGLFSTFTPCVLPMLPITLGTLGVSRASSWLMGVFTSFSYVAGIVLSFGALGVLFAFTGTLFGTLLGHPITAVLLALLFVILAFSCFDILSLTLPGRLTRHAASIGGRGPVGAFASGLVAGVVSSPCIGPILAAILSFVVTTRNVGYGGLLLSAYGLGFGLPFLLVGAFALRLPRGGQWMVAIKGVFGISLLVGAFWFLRGAFPSLRISADLGSALAATVTAVTAYVVLTCLDYGRPVFRTAIVVLAMLSGCALISALASPRLAWCQESPDNQCLSRAQAIDGRTVVLFSAELCTACHELKSQTFADERVRRRLSIYSTVVVDVDRNADLRKKYCPTGAPLVAVLDREGNVVASFTEVKTPGETLLWFDQLESGTLPEPKE